MPPLIYFLLQFGTTAAFIQTTSDSNRLEGAHKLILSLTRPEALPCRTLLTYSRNWNSQGEYFICAATVTSLRPHYIISDVNRSVPYSNISVNAHMAPCVLAFIFIRDRTSQMSFELAPVLGHPLIDLRRDYLVIIASQIHPALNAFRTPKMRKHLKYAIFAHQANDDTVDVYRLCPHCEQNNSSLTPLITIAERSDYDTVFFQDIYRNLHQNLLRISLLTISNNVQLRPINGTLRPYKTGGYFLRSALTVCEVLNATFTLIPRPRYTLRRRNGTLEPGMFKDLEEGVADFAAAGAVSARSYEVVELATPMGNDFYTFYHAPPRPVFTISNILHPFSSTLWLSLLATIVSILVSLRLLHMVRPKELKLWPFGRTSAFILASCVLQFIDKPGRPALRIFALHWYIFVVVITTGYCAKLYGIFVRPPTEPAPETFAQLGNSGYEVGFVDVGDKGAALSSHFTHSKEGSGERKVPEKWIGLKPIQCMETAVTKHKFACIFFGENQANLIAILSEKFGNPNSGHSLLERSHDLALPFFIALLFPKRSLLLPTVNKIMSHIIAGHLMAHWKRETDRELRQERRKAGLKTKRSGVRLKSPALQYQVVRYIFDLFAFGLIASASGLFGELWCNYHEETIRECKASIKSRFKKFLKWEKGSSLDLPTSQSKVECYSIPTDERSVGTQQHLFRLWSRNISLILQKR